MMPSPTHTCPVYLARVHDAARRLVDQRPPATRPRPRLPRARPPTASDQAAARRILGDLDRLGLGIVITIERAVSTAQLRVLSVEIRGRVNKMKAMTSDKAIQAGPSPLRFWRCPKGGA